MTNKEKAHSQLKPSLLEFEIGAYGSDTYKLEWLNSNLVFTMDYTIGFPERGVLFEPTEAEWKTFWSMLEDIKIWNWAPKYTAPVIDGTGWSLEIKYGNKSIETHGHMAWPDPDDLSKAVELEVTDPFNNLINALNTLCGEECIPH